jgi:hypothetical protein
MELLDEILYGVWYWYTSIKSMKIFNLKIFGWNFSQEMCFFAFV